MTSTDKTITQILEEITKEMCDKYCKYPEKYKDQDEMCNTICAHCPLIKL